LIHLPIAAGFPPSICEGTYVVEGAAGGRVQSKRPPGAPQARYPKRRSESPIGDKFINAVPLTRLFAWGEGDSGGHVLLETSRGLCGRRRAEWNKDFARNSLAELRVGDSGSDHAGVASSLGAHALQHPRPQAHRDVPRRTFLGEGH